MKASPISGFPEWLPSQRLIEQKVLDVVRETFELYGFAPIETSVVERLEVLLHKGDDKEIYVLRRLHEEDPLAAAEFGLHFDLTVPTARYVLQHRGQLNFPFKRYQIQKCWRGERPQEGRFREFLQADIDVIAEGELALHYDAEFPQLMVDITSKLPVPPVTVKVNNRKILSGFYLGLGIKDAAATMRIMDKLDKIGADNIAALLQAEAALSKEQAERCLALGQIKTPDTSFVQKVEALGVDHALLAEGLAELEFVMRACAHLPKGSVLADLSVARGLDYYTGTVFESEMQGFEHIGSICSGGRYDNLASDSKVRLPGVGISFGITRMLAPLLMKGLLTANKSTPVVVLVALPKEEDRLAAMNIANQLRQRGIPADVHHAPQKYGKQIRAAEKRGIPYVWFFGDKHEIKDIRSGHQQEVHPETWQPPEADKDVEMTLRLG